MKKIFITFGFLLVFYSITYAQTTAPFNVEGTWKVVGGEFLSPTPLTKSIAKQLTAYKELFFNSVFIFNSDHGFNFDIAIDEIKIQHGHWKYNADFNRYQIQEWADKDKDNSFLMFISVKREGDKTFFVLPTGDDLAKEFLIKLEVVKLME